MPAPRVALFVTCLVDLFRPSVGFATVKLLEDAGCTVEVPAAQTCCGQPAWNSGDRETAKAMARRVIAAFEGYDYVVAPSGSCGATIARDYPAMLADDPAWAERARALAARTFEVTAFLADVLGVTAVAGAPAVVTYHDSCSGLRSLGVRAQPRRLLAVDRRARAARDGGERRLLRLRRDLLRQVPGDLRRDGRRQDPGASPRPGRRWCWRATSAA